MRQKKEDGGWIILIDALLQSRKFLDLLESLYPDVDTSVGNAYTINHIVNAFPSELFTYKNKYKGLFAVLTDQ